MLWACRDYHDDFCGLYPAVHAPYFGHISYTRKISSASTLGTTLQGSGCMLLGILRTSDHKRKSIWMLVELRTDIAFRPNGDGKLAEWSCHAAVGGLTCTLRPGQIWQNDMPLSASPSELLRIVILIYHPHDLAIASLLLVPKGPNGLHSRGFSPGADVPASNHANHILTTEPFKCFRVPPSAVCIAA